MHRQSSRHLVAPEFSAALDGFPLDLLVVPGGFHGYTIARDSPQVRMVEKLERRALARALGIALNGPPQGDTK
jgi:hypothetical protein